MALKQKEFEVLSLELVSRSKSKFQQIDTLKKQLSEAERSLVINLFYSLIRPFGSMHCLKAGMHNIRPAEAFCLARKAHNFAYLACLFNKTSFEKAKHVSFGPWT